MEGMQLAEVAELAGARVVQGEGEQLVQNIATDSRRISPGELFWALVGERFDGHDYAGDAIKAGAVGIVCACSKLSKVIGQLADFEAGKPALLTVNDTLLALQRLAQGYRQRFSLPVVGVTGSVGKTTTKDLTHAALSSRYKTLKTQGNFNNEIGLPLTLLRLDRTYQAAVLEMGMRGKGQIEMLARIAQPSVGVITNVRPVHVELLGSMEAIAGAKAELVEALPESGCAVLNGDDPFVAAMAGKARCRVLTYGTRADVDLSIQSVRVLGRDGVDVDFGWRGQRYKARVPVPGEHNAYNAAAAVLAGIACGLSIEEAAAGLIGFVPSGLRMEVVEGPDGTVVINDSYNANPAAMEAAIQTALGIAGARPLWLILGDMLELGVMASAEHRRLGELAAQAKAALLLAVGQYRSEVAAGALQSGMDGSRILTAADAEEAERLCAGLDWHGGTVLVKGSRGVGLERVAHYLVSAAFAPKSQYEGQGGRRTR